MSWSFRLLVGAGHCLMNSINDPYECYELYERYEKLHMNNTNNRKHEQMMMPYDVDAFM